MLMRDRFEVVRPNLLVYLVLQSCVLSGNHLTLFQKICVNTDKLRDVWLLLKLISTNYIFLQITMVQNLSSAKTVWCSLKHPKIHLILGLITMPNLVVISHTVCAHVGVTNVLRTLGPTLVGGGVADCVEIRSCLTWVTAPNLVALVQTVWLVTPTCAHSRSGVPKIGGHWVPAPLGLGHGWPIETRYTPHVLRLLPYQFQGSYKSWKVVEFKVEIFQVWKIMENDLRLEKSWKVWLLTWKIRMFITCQHLLLFLHFVSQRNKFFHNFESNWSLETYIDISKADWFGHSSSYLLSVIMEIAR